MASLPPPLVPRTHLAVGKVGHYLVAAGGNRYDIAEKGYSASTIPTCTEVFDLAEPETGLELQRSPLPGSPRGWTASTGLEGKLYVFGGVTFAGRGESPGQGPRSRNR